MTALRASYSIAPDVLLRFNALVPSSERSRTAQSLMEGIVAKREKVLEAVAQEFATHPDFAQARADSLLWDATTHLIPARTAPAHRARALRRQSQLHGPVPPNPQHRQNRHWQRAGRAQPAGPGDSRRGCAQGAWVVGG